MKKTPKKKCDRALLFYNEVLGLKHLHYGLWDEDDDLTLKNLEKAQERYQDLIISHIPQEAKTVLDVGCGMGTLLAKLQRQGYVAEGLSPDEHQQQKIVSAMNIPFHFYRFEDFLPPHTYDTIIMSESAQYIPIEKIFEKTAESLSPQGELIVCDYFLRNEAQGIFKKSGHNYEQFLHYAHKKNFSLIQKQDITSKVLKTLTLGENLINKTVKTFEIGTFKVRKKHPFLTRILHSFFRKKIKKFYQEMELLDAKNFQKNKIYALLSFRYQAQN